MSFLFQSILAIGVPLIGIPLLIHLINLRRHQRVEWAAMEFLLESQKRNKKWIVLKQLLLLLLRTAAVALVVFMLAGPVIRSGWASLFGRGVTHHLILLDDSYSMSDRWEESSAFDEAKQAVSRILDQAR
ncbi:MAG TPA: BatA domain-containing protein, partial [Lacipirellula sp.]